MNRELLIFVIPAIVAVIGALLKTFAIPFFKNKVLPYFYSKTSHNQRKLLYNYVNRAVTVAENIFSEKGQGKAKKEFVLNFIHMKFGWKVDEEILDKFIESAVEELNKYKVEMEREEEKDGIMSGGKNNTI